MRFSKNAACHSIESTAKADHKNEPAESVHKVIGTGAHHIEYESRPWYKTDASPEVDTIPL